MNFARRRIGSEGCSAPVAVNVRVLKGMVYGEPEPEKCPAGYC